SFGGGGMRSYSRPATQPRQTQQMSPQQRQFQQPMGGGFMRSMAGGIVGGMLGGMLFRSLGLAGAGGMGGGGGIGLFEILLIAGIGYFIYRMVKRKRAEAALSQDSYSLGYQQPTSLEYAQPYQAPQDDLAAGLSHIRQMDPGFDEQRFSDSAMDVFFKIQGAWMNRDMAPVSGLLTDEMRRIFQTDIDNLLREKRINRLENIAVRNVEIVEAWQESGQDYTTALIYANLLDYTTDETSGAVVDGSKTDPVKFEEFWTFTRRVGNNPWQLSAIAQK
ncbi:MAG: Tim44 domain-containing protein, partial [Geobacteraceae bacterium]